MTILFFCLRKRTSNIYFIDSTPLKVCHNKRISRHKVFKDLAQRGKSSMGWFYGFKLHLVVDSLGNIANAKLTPGNTDDRSVVESLVQSLKGKLFGDKGYISKELFMKLYAKGIKFITGIRKNMNNILMLMEDKILLRKRSVIETIFGYLKQTLMLEHTRHRSIIGMFLHVLSTLVWYQIQPSKPSAFYDISNP
jgi:transposase